MAGGKSKKYVHRRLIYEEKSGKSTDHLRELIRCTKVNPREKKASQASSLYALSGIAMAALFLTRQTTYMQKICSITIFARATIVH